MAFLGAGILVAALASGAAVLVVTMISDRLGGSVGGLLATAPVTTTAALLYLSIHHGTTGLADRIAIGGGSLFAAILPMPAYFYTLKATPKWPVALRLAAALVVFLVLFTAVTMVADAVTAPSWRMAWFAGVLILVAMYAATFMRVRIDPVHLRGPKPPLTWVEGVARFLVGSAVIALVALIGSVSDTLGSAWAVFPGVFLVTLGVLGVGHGAAYSARAAQAGVLGGVPLAAFLLTYWALIPLASGTWWAFVAMLPAWVAYFSVLVPVFRLRQRFLAY